jgi:uncharacterized protein YegP (UPF0339 family)
MNAPIAQQYHRRTDAEGKSYFVLKGKNGEIIGKSQSYSSTAATERGIQSVKTNAPSATIEGVAPPRRSSPGAAGLILRNPSH